VAAKATSPSASLPRERWELLAAWSSFRRATPRGPSQHLAGSYEGEVWVNEAAAAYPAGGLRQPLAPGAVLVETHHPRGSDDVVVRFVMTKRNPGFDAAGGDWEYAVVTAAGDVEQRGLLPVCVRCHAEAGPARVFGHR
jgi:hypothetical protein